MRHPLTLSLLAGLAWLPLSDVRAQAPAFTPPRGLRTSRWRRARRQPDHGGQDHARRAALLRQAALARPKEMSCETCHVPEKGWTDGLKLSPKFDGSMNTRHSPTLYGVGLLPRPLLGRPGQGPGGADPGRLEGPDGRGSRRDRQGAGAAVPGYKAAFEKELGGAAHRRPHRQGAGHVRAHHPCRRHAVRPPARRRRATRARPARASRSSRKSRSARYCHLPPSSRTRSSTTSASASTTRSPTSGAARSWPTPPQGRHSPRPPEAETLQGAFKTPTLARRRAQRALLPRRPRGHARGGGRPHDQGRHREPEPRREAQGGNAHGRAAQQLLAFLRSLTPERSPTRGRSCPDRAVRPEKPAKEQQQRERRHRRRLRRQARPQRRRRQQRQRVAAPPAAATSSSRPPSNGIG